MTRTRITTDGITDASVTTQKINDSAVTTGKIANAAVTDDKINDVAAAKITGQIATSQVADGAITDAKITSAGLAPSSLNWSAIQPWAANTAYAKGALVEFQGIAYRRSAAGTSGASFNSANWQQITPRTYPNTLITGLGTMSTATATDYLARAGGTMTGAVQVTAGTAAAPGVAISGDADTGITQTAAGGANTLSVATNGVERWRVGADGATQSVIPGGSTLLPQFQCRAWVNFNGTGTVAIRGSGNVSSITDNGVGLYTVNFSTSLPDANYSVALGGGDISWGNRNFIFSLATSSFGIQCISGSTNSGTDAALICAAVFR